MMAVQTSKESKQRLEVFDGGIEGLYRYYRARRMLVSCLLLPPLAGAMYATKIGWVALLLPILLLFNKSSAGYLSELSVYVAGGDLAEKSKREKALLWEDLKHQFAGMALVLLATTVFLLAWRQQDGAHAEGVRLRIATQVCYVFIFCLLLGLRCSVIDILTARRKTIAVVIFATISCSFWLGVAEIDFNTKMAANIALFLLPPALCTYWLVASSRQDDFLQLAHSACLAALVAVIVSYGPVWKLPWFYHFGFGKGAWFEQAPSGAMWLGASLLLAYATATSLSMAFIRTERIRLGQFCSSPSSMLRGSSIWWPKKDGRIFILRWMRRHVARAGKPFLGTARHWKRVRRVTLLGERPWEVGALSSAATLYLLYS